MKTKALEISFILSLVFAISSCKDDKIIPEKEVKTEHITISESLTAPTIKSGFYGHVFKLVEDLNPDPNLTIPDWGVWYPVSITNRIYLFSPLYLNNLKSALFTEYLPLYNLEKINAKPLFIITPNSKGFYQIELPRGKYSAFVQINGDSLYINGADHTGIEGILNKNTEGLINHDLIVDMDRLLK